MARRIVTDTFLTITGPGTTIKVCRALQDSNGNVAVWWKPKVAPQRLYTVGKAGLGLRGNMVGPDGTIYAYRRRGVSCTWAICKGKFTTKQVAAWWPDGSAAAATASPELRAAAEEADEEPAPDPVRERAAAAARASRGRVRTRPVTASERRAARARARAARATKAAVAERRAAVEQAATVTDPGETVTSAPEIATEEERVAAYALNPDTVPVPVPEPEPNADQTPLADTGLTPRTLSALAAANITTVGDLLAETEESLSSIKGFGPKSLSEVTDMMTGRDRTTTPKPDPVEPEPATPPTNAEIRAWARDNGYAVPSRGKIPDAVLEAFHNAPQAEA